MAKTKTEGKKSKPWWLAGLLIILLSVAGSVGVYLLLDSRSVASEDEVTQAAPPAEAKPPIFVPVQPFTVNIHGRPRRPGPAPLCGDPALSHARAV